MSKILVVSLFISFHVEQRISVPEFLSSLRTLRNSGSLTVGDDDESILVGRASRTRSTRKTWWTWRTWGTFETREAGQT